MFKLILFHPGIDLKQKLYLIHQYCICFYIDCFMYLVEKYFIELDKSVDEYLRIQKIYKILKKRWGGKGGKCFLRDFNLVHKDIKKDKKQKKRFNKLWFKALSKSGKKGAKTGKQLRKMITPTKKAQKKIKSLGINYKLKVNLGKDSISSKMNEMLQKEKDELYSHIIKNNLGPQDANKILNVAGILGNSGINLLEYVTTNIDFIYWYKNQSDEIKKKLSLYEYDNERSPYEKI